MDYLALLDVDQRHARGDVELRDLLIGDTTSMVLETKSAASDPKQTLTLRNSIILGLAILATGALVGREEID